MLASEVLTALHALHHPNSSEEIRDITWCGNYPESNDTTTESST